MDLTKLITQLDQIGRLLERYGLAPIFVGILVFLIIRFGIGKQNSSSKEKDDNANQANIDQEHAGEVPRLFQLDAKIGSILMEMSTSLGAGWVTVWQLHNGTISLAGVPFLKVSATHEAGAPNMYLWAKDYRDLPVSLFVMGVDCIGSSNLRHFVIDSNDECVSPAILGTMRHLGIHRVYSFLLKTTHGTLIGLLTLAFVDEHILSADEIDRSQMWATQISILLEEYPR